MLDVIAERSRGALLAGEQLICLVQSRWLIPGDTRA